MTTTGSPIRQTYFALRSGLVLLVALLLLSVVIETIAASCRLGSLSAYYFTAARAVFVGSLCAIGGILMIYRGNTDTENMLLNFSGFLAFLVAFIPTGLDDSCSQAKGIENITAQVTNNFWALVVIGLVAVLFSVRLETDRGGGEGLSRYAQAALTVSALALVAGIFVFVANPELVVAHGHDVAAITFFVFIIAVVWTNALDRRRQRGGSPSLPWLTKAIEAGKNRYGVMAFVMTISAAVGIALVANDLGLLFWLEVLLIVEFAIFWGMQTAEMRGRAARS